MNRNYKAPIIFGIYFVFIAFGIIWFLNPDAHQHIPADILSALIGGATAGFVFYWMMKLIIRFKARKAKNA